MENQQPEVTFEITLEQGEVIEVLRSGRLVHFVMPDDITVEHGKFFVLYNVAIKAHYEETDGLWYFHSKEQEGDGTFHIYPPKDRKWNAKRRVALFYYDGGDQLRSLMIDTDKPLYYGDVIYAKRDDSPKLQDSTSNADTNDYLLHVECDMGLGDGFIVTLLPVFFKDTLIRGKNMVQAVIVE